MSGDQYKALMDFKSDRPDAGPRFALTYIAVSSVLIAAVLVSWLGWTWVAVVAYVVILAAVVGGWLYLRIRSRRLADERRATLRQGDRWT